MKRQARVLNSGANSLARVAEDKLHVAKDLTDGETHARLKRVVKPNSVSRTLRKAGVLVLMSPDPFTDVPGAVLLGASYLMKKREPADILSVARETRKVLRELQSLV